MLTLLRTRLMRNYLKVPGQVASEAKFFFFTDTQPSDRASAWSAALHAAGGDPCRVSIWHGNSLGRYPGERPGNAHSVVSMLEPISPECRVIGVPFETRGKWD